MSQRMEQIEKGPQGPRVGAHIKRALGGAVLPMAAVLAMPVSAIAAPKLLSAGAVAKATMNRIRHHHPVTSCPGEATVPINLNPGGEKYDPQITGGDPSSNNIPASQAIVFPMIVSRTNPNAVVSGSADFENGDYDVAGLDPSTPLRVKAYPVSSTTSFDIDSAACVPTVFRDYRGGGINPNDAFDPSYTGFGSSDLGPVGEMSLVP